MAGKTFLYDKRELRFILNEWLDMDKLYTLPEYEECEGISDAIIDMTYDICKEKISIVNDESDRIGVKFVDGKVITPPSFKEGYKVLNEAGLAASNADRTAEGHLPLTLVQANYEMLSHASQAFTGYWGLTSGAISVIQQFGSPFLKEKFLPNLINGKWGGTMNLTEADAGTDVGANITKAIPTDDPGIYKIEGNKIFITAADHDLCENFIHLVLARTPDAKPGTGGLSLFIVPKYWVNDDGSLGEFNDVITTGIEEKMGQHGSPTCSLTYGSQGKCRGYIIGNPPDENGRGQGIAQMFVMMNEERLNTGTQALGAMSEAYLLSREYAKVRVQGNSFTNPKGPKVRIIEHEDVRRMLMLQKACVEATRALIFKTCFYLDLAHSSNDPEEKEFADGMFQMNNPLCKAYTADLSWPMIGEAIQIFGGYGYCTDYQVEQLARDSKIHSIWEGTDFIQSLDLVGRKFNLKKGAIFKKWQGTLQAFIDTNKDNVEFSKEINFLAKAWENYKAILGQLMTYVKAGKMQMIPLFSTRILHATSMVYCASLLLDQAILANKKLSDVPENNTDANFYKGKIAKARFYTLNILPEIIAIKTAIEIGDTSAIDMPEACFNS